jgi:hypothetical protein
MLMLYNENHLRVELGVAIKQQEYEGPADWEHLLCAVVRHRLRSLVRTLKLPVVRSYISSVNPIINSEPMSSH